MKTIRLLYPDHVSGGLSTYYLGAKLLACMLPDNPAQPWVKVEIPAPDGVKPVVKAGIAGLDAVLGGIRAAQQAIAAHAPERIITVGGTCLVSLASFDYLHGLYPDAGIIWIDAHPDVSTPADGYPCAHAMVLGTLLGRGAAPLAGTLKNGAMAPERVMYVGLQGVLDYQKKTLEELGVNYRVQSPDAEPLAAPEEVAAFAGRFKHVFVHFDIDVLDPSHFHSTYFANPELTGDGSGGGRMRIAEVENILAVVAAASSIAGLTIAEYLPFDEERLAELFARLGVLTEEE